MGQNSKNGNYFQQGGVRAVASVIVLILAFVKISYVIRHVGLNGFAYYVQAVLILTLLMLINGLFSQGIIKRMTGFSLNRKGYKNADRIFRITSYVNLLQGCIVALIIILLSEKLSILLFGNKLMSLALSIVAVVYVFLVLGEVIKGYLSGLNNALPCVVSSYIFAGISLFTTVIFQSSCNSYGKKMSLYMGVEEYYFAYASLSSLIGLLAGAVLQTLFLCLISALLKNVLREKIKKDSQKNVLSVKEIMGNYFGNTGNKLIREGSFMATIIVLLLVACINQKVGEIYIPGIGIVILLFLPCFILLRLMTISLRRNINYAVKKSDFHFAKEKISLYMKVFFFTVLPYLAFILGGTKMLALLLTDFDGEIFLGIIRFGTVVILFAAFSILLEAILFCIEDTGKVYLVLYLTSILAILVFPAILSKGMILSKAFLLSVLLKTLLEDIILFMLLFRKIGGFRDWIRIFILPLVSAITVFIVCFIISRFQIPSIFVQFCISAILGYIVCAFVTVFMHTFDRYELNEIPFSGIMKFLFQKMNI